MRPIKIAVFVAPSIAALGLFLFAFARDAEADRLAAAATTGDGIWETIDNSSMAVAHSQPPAPGSSQVLRLNKAALVQQLMRAPMEGTGDLRKSPAVLALPMPDGSFLSFRIEESPIMAPSLAARLPGVKTFRGQGIDDPTATTRFDWTPKGFHALILSSQGSVYIEPASTGETTEYVTHLSQNTPAGAFGCGVTEADVAEATARGIYSGAARLTELSPDVSNGPTLRTYRLAVAATGEWTTQYGGGNAPGAQTAITTIINLVNAIYERETAIRFTLVNNTSIIFTDENTDPYASPNAADDAALTANQTTLDGAGLGAANYDIGHLFGSGPGFFSGVATLGVTCTTGSKARGVSTMNGSPLINAAFVGGIAHEIGHQFSADHTFNASTGASCSNQRTATSAYEVGGGSTIMSYQVCEAENLQPRPDPYFHVHSLQQVLNYATNNAMCAASSATNNTAPTVAGPGNFTIPRNTPFTLTANASDTNGPLTYSWEEYDLGTASPPNTDDGTRPIFRGYKPTDSSSRTFPSLQYILNNANVPPATYNGGCVNNAGTVIPCLTGESLPTTSRTMNFQVVVRDNQANGGGINTATSVLTVINTPGPFAVTAPNGGGTLSGAQNVTWSVNNTNSAPINCANVRITLSTDGGNTFPITLAASTANNGTAAVVIPNGINSAQARVKVEGIGNIFFDISDANFTVVPADTCPAVSGISSKFGAVGQQVTITGINFTNGGNVTGVKFSNNVTATFNVVNNTTITTTVPAGAIGGVITVSKNGCPDVQTDVFSICPSAAVSLSITGDTAGGLSDFGDRAWYVNRLTPASYPATLTQVSIFFGNLAPGTPINVVAGGNPGGTANINGIAFQTLATTQGGLNQYITYTLPNPLKITSGDFVVGFEVPTRQSQLNEQPGAADTTQTLPDRSYTSPDGETFFPFNMGGNFMIRASQVFIGNCTGAAAIPGLVGNVSTRLPVGTGDNVLIEGFIVQGPVGSTKKIMVRAIGPALIPFGIPDAVQNPTLEIRDSGQAVLAMNNDWKTTQVGGIITGDQFPEISASGLAPGNDLESAIIANLSPGSYTAIMRGLNDTVGTGLLDAYDISAASPARLVNISTRGLIQPGDKLMIAGFIIQNAPVRAVVRAIGPSLAAFGITNALPDTTLDLRDQNGSVRFNDDWKTTQQAELEALGLQPSNDLEAALVHTLPPGQYTALVRGKPEATGTGVVEVYFVP